jgi:hypothetical protein
MRLHAQMVAIIDKLSGTPSNALPDPSALDEPWRTIFRRVTRASDRSKAEFLIWEATGDLDLDIECRRQLTRDFVALLPHDDAFTPFPSLQEMSGRFPPVDWLWPSWIPRGMLTLLGAAPGVGKSLVALDLARRIIHGEPFPDGAPVPHPGGNVLIVDAEGAPALLNQRAQAWDIDRRRLFLMLAPEPGGLIDLADPPQQLQLLRMCRQIRPALVVVDSLAAATARGETSLEAARALLGLLATIACRARVALLLVHHLRKRARSTRAASTPQVVADDLRGSSHISAAARSVLALSLPGRALPAPEPPVPVNCRGGDISGAGHQSYLDGPRRLEVVKTNLCRVPPPLTVIFEGEDVPVLRYSPWVEPKPPPTHVDLCARWLLQFLAAAGEPVKPADVVRAAAEAGFPRPTLYRARRALAGAIVDLGSSPHDPRKRWTLAAPPSPPSPPP